VRRICAPFAIDLRTLALFRVCFGMILIADLVTRAGALTAHYTDLGIWPRYDAAAAFGEAGFSLHLLGGSSGFQAALFALAGVLAGLLVIGYRTRVVSVLCWLMLASLNHRNYWILQTSDTLMLSLLFWSLFLPMGARFSVDAALNRNRIEDKAVCSPASASLLIQVLSVYFFGALLKTGDSWVLTGDAVHVALHFSHYASPLGVWAGETLSPGVLRALTHYTRYIELYGPILVLLPFYTAKIRFVLVPGLMLLHVGFALLLTVGIYPYLSITSLMLLIPGEFWDRARARLSTAESRGLTIYYDSPCSFCRKVCLLLRTFFLLGPTPVLPAQDRPEILELLEKHNSWVVEDFDGVRYVRWEAMIVLFRRSWLLSPVAGLFDNAPLRSLGERFYAWVAAHREQLGRVCAVILPYGNFHIRSPRLVHLGVSGLMVIVIYSNVARLPQLELDYPWTFQRIIHALLLNQYWTMFAPNPGRNTQWLFAEGQLEDGRKVDVYGDSFQPPLMEKPADGSGYFQGYRWRKYFNAVDLLEHWPRLVGYYCARWNRNHPETPVLRVTGFVLHERTRFGPPQARKWDHQLLPLGSTWCEHRLSRAVSPRDRQAGDVPGSVPVS